LKLHVKKRIRAAYRGFTCPSGLKGGKEARLSWQVDVEVRFLAREASLRLAPCLTHFDKRGDNLYEDACSQEAGSLETTAEGKHESRRTYSANEIS
jgi:hypothetical protein